MYVVMNAWKRLGLNFSFVNLSVWVSPRRFAIARLKSAKAARMGLRVTTNAAKKLSLMHCAHLLVFIKGSRCSKIFTNEAFLPKIDGDVKYMENKVEGEFIMNRDFNKFSILPSSRQKINAPVPQKSYFFPFDPRDNHHEWVSLNGRHVVVAQHFP